MAMSASLKKTVVVAAVLVTAGLGWYAWSAMMADNGPGEGFVSGNGRIEAVEIDVATKLPGRVEEILAKEGDFVKKAQPLARMQIDTLEAQLDEVNAGRQEALHAVTAAEAQVALRESDVAAMRAVVSQREAELDAARRRLSRSETLSKEGASSRQELDDDRARVRSAEAALAASKSQVLASLAAVEAAKAQKIGAQSRVTAVEATMKRVQADIDDSLLKSPRDGRIQFRVAEPGEVLGAGGRVLNLVDLADVYMTFFLPETVAGRVAIGTEARIILDAAPELVIPAHISFVASTAQFTPKTVETESERQKLMFRVKAQIPPALLRKHLEQVKTGLPGVAWVKYDADKAWPEWLNVKVPE